MENQHNKINKGKFVNWSIEAAIQIGLVALIIFSSYLIFKPFIVPVVWGIIIAVALFPLAKRMNVLLGNRKTLAAVILTILILALVIIPLIFFTGSIIDSIRELAQNVEEGKPILPITENNSELSAAKQFVIEKWNELSQNMSDLLMKIGPQLKEAVHFLVSSLSGLVGSVFFFIASIIIAGAFLSNSEGGYNFTLKLFKRLTGDKAVEMLDLSVATIRSVMQGVIGVAVIQALLVGIGFFIVGVPGATILTLVVMIMAIVQLPPIIIIIPVVFYVFSTASSGVAIVFTIWSVLASLSDNVLKPMFLGRGLDIPMLVILIGAIGGMISSGLIGLFIGPVVLALGYKLFQAWVEEQSANIDDVDSPL